MGEGEGGDVGKLGGAGEIEVEFGDGFFTGGGDAELEDGGGGAVVENGGGDLRFEI